MTNIEAIIEDCRLMRVDFEPHEWPAISMRDITSLCDEVERLHALRDAMLTVLEELECSAYWSEYDVTVGIRGRIKAAVKQARGDK